MAFTDEDRALLAPYVTSLESPVFCLRNLPEEVIAVLFAYYSRSEGTLRDNLLRLLRDEELAVVGGEAARLEEDLLRAREKARQFHEKWVVGYGHRSVAEHAVAHVAVEDVSILVSKAIEDCRLASYTEKSTRYVPFRRAYYPAPELDPASAARYRETVELLFDRYESLLPELTRRVQERADRSAFATERGFLASCRAQACDALRYLLPAAVHTNLGLTANARALEHMISKLLSHPLREARETGERIRREATKLIPTLIKYAAPQPYWMETPPRVRALAERLLPSPEPRGTAGLAHEDRPVRLVLSTPEAEARLAAAILYEAGAGSYESVWSRVRALPQAAIDEVIETYLAGRRTHGRPPHAHVDPPLRCLEHVSFTFEIVVDFGAWRDIQRHRMATQTAAPLSCDLGYELPPLLQEAPFQEPAAEALERAGETYESLRSRYPEEAAYVVPLAYRRRTLITWNLRELYHFIPLRSSRQGHPAYRRVAWACYDELAREHPLLARFIPIDRSEYDLARPG